MKKIIALALSGVLVSCSPAMTSTLGSVSNNVGIGNITVVETPTAIEITNKRGVDLDQNTLAVTGLSTDFKMTDSRCWLEDQKYNIWNCNLGYIKNAAPVLLVSKEGKAASGTLFSYEKGTNKFVPSLVKTY